MLEISSLNNELIKKIVKLQQKKYRDEENKFLLEGYKCIKEAFEFNLKIEHLFVTEEHLEKYSFLKSKAILVSEAILKKISTTDSTPEAVAIGVQKKFTIKDLKNAKNIALFENIKDLGNLGTILRSATAFNIDGIILFGETVDLYNPKCVRSAVGNLWKIPVVKLNDTSILKENFKNYEKIATLPKSNNTIALKDFKPKEFNLVMFGSEADGLTDELKSLADTNLTIEMKNNVESLNLSISAALIFYKLFLL